MLRGSKFPEQLSNRESSTYGANTRESACVDGKMIREKFAAFPLTVFPALVSRPRLLKYNRVARRSWIVSTVDFFLTQCDRAEDSSITFNEEGREKGQRRRGTRRASTTTARHCERKPI